DVLHAMAHQHTHKRVPCLCVAPWASEILRRSRACSSLLECYQGRREGRTVITLSGTAEVLRQAPGQITFLVDDVSSSGERLPTYPALERLRWITGRGVWSHSHDR